MVRTTARGLLREVEGEPWSHLEERRRVVIQNPVALSTMILPSSRVIDRQGTRIDERINLAPDTLP
jgi:hypothetical protein